MNTNKTHIFSFLGFAVGILCVNNLWADVSTTSRFSGDAANQTIAASVTRNKCKILLKNGESILASAELKGRIWRTYNGEDLTVIDFKEHGFNGYTYSAAAFFSQGENYVKFKLIVDYVTTGSAFSANRGPFIGKVKSLEGLDVSAYFRGEERSDAYSANLLCN